jgi:hypothetical protein
MTALRFKTVHKKCIVPVASICDKGDFFTEETLPKEPKTNGVIIVTIWLRYYVTSWKVAGSNPDEVDVFN